MTEYTLALVAALIVITAGVVYIALQQSKRLAELKKAQAQAEALAKAADLAKQQAAREEALKKARTAAKKKQEQAQEPILGVVAPKKATPTKKKTK